MALGFFDLLILVIAFRLLGKQVLPTTTTPSITVAPERTVLISKCEVISTITKNAIIRSHALWELPRL